MRCIDEALFMKLLLGEVSPERTPEVEAHLDTCASCRQLVAEGMRAQNPDEPDTDRTKTVLPGRAARKEDAPLEKGTAVGRYLVLEVLGTGGMGVVYSAYDPELDRRVALKLLRVSALGLEAEEGRAHLVREAKAMARVSHPHVVSVYDVGTFGQQVFLAMELVEAQTLRQWLKATSRPWRQVLALFLDAGRGLAAAHAAGVVHGDFKPENLLVGRDGRVRVTDFGLARLGSPASGGQALPAAAALVPLAGMDHSAVGGTPAYMAPEQLLSNARAGTAGDQFAFCITLHEALYGERPFEGTSLTALTAELRAGRVRPPPSGTRVPPWLRRVVLRGLATRPEERYPSLETLLAALQKDPAARWRRGLQVAGGVALLASAVGLTHAVSTRGARACEGAPEAVAAIWGPTQQGTAESAFLATGQPYAAGAWQRVRRELDAYTAAWTTTRTTACEATRVRGEQSEEALAWRMRCLDSRLADVAALTRVLSQADAGVVAEAHRAVERLSPVSGCTEGFIPSLAPRAPQDAATLARVEALRAALAEGRALKATGRYAQGVARVEPVVKAAKEAGDRAEGAEAFLLLGELREGAGDWKGAEAALFDAVDAAEATRQDPLAARAWTLLVRVSTVGLDEYGLAARWSNRAAAAIDRLGGEDARLRVKLLTYSGTLLRKRFLLDEALAQEQQALALVERAFGADSLEAADVHQELGTTLQLQQRYDDAGKHMDRAVALTRQAVGDGHPELARVQLAQAYLLREQGKLAEAESLAREMLAIFERTLGPEHPRVYDALNDLATAVQQQKRPEEALALYQRALVIARKTDGPESRGVAAIESNVGVLFMEQGKLDEALAHLKASVAIRDKHPSMRDGLQVFILRLISRLLKQQERHEEVLAYRQRAVDLLLTLPDDAYKQWTIALLDLASAYLKLNRPAEAVSAAERALAGWEHAAVVPGHRTDTRFMLARALWDSGRDRERALRLATEARKMALEDGAGAETLKRINTWLAERGVR
ncbi:MAG TPA: tetratricopeptide repeat protein [Myxococcus sp.]|nr:tetratricopeptide repeat protein [Myxococcus sp.]